MGTNYIAFGEFFFEILKKSGMDNLFLKSDAV
jgi:hypothetical protein